MISARLLVFVLSVCALAAAPGAGASFAQTPSEGLTADARLGWEKYEARQFVDATKLLKKAVKKNSADHVSWYYLGLSLLPQNKPKDAAKAFENSIKLRPNFASAHAGLAYALMNRNKLLEAEREARASLAIDDKMVDAHYILGVVQLRTGWREKALESGETAIKLKPDFAPAYLLKSRALVSFFDDAVIAPLQEPAEVRRGALHAGWRRT